MLEKAQIGRPIMPQKRGPKGSVEKTYDAEADAMYIRLRYGAVVESREDDEHDGIIVDYDENGNVLGIEILWVSSRNKYKINKIIKKYNYL